jgi:hypothetical protein
VLVAVITNSSKAKFSIGPSQCYLKKATESRVSLSLWDRSELVSGISACVSLRNQKSPVLAVRSQRLARVAVISQVRSFSVYLVVSCCVSSQ